jgi:23S rRNA-/tRNA-specific pseudouridylate synthase
MTNESTETWTDNSEQTETLEKLWETQFERCDACPQSAYFSVTLATGKLHFCRHHFLANKEALYEIAEDILDESEMLLSK